MPVNVDVFLNLAGDGSAISNLNASNLAFGVVNSSLIYGNTLSNIQFSNVTGLLPNTISNLNASNLSFGVVSSALIYGNTLSNINASNIVGTVPSSVSGNTLSNINASNLAFGVVPSSLIYGNTLSNINASNITTGTLSSTLIYGNTLSNISGSNVTTGINASNITTGILSSTLIFGNTLSNINGSNVTTGINASNITTGILSSTLIFGNTLSNIQSSNITITQPFANLVVSNTVTASNLYLSGGILTGSTGGTLVKGAVEFNTTDNVFYSTAVNLRGFVPSQFIFQTTGDVGITTTIGTSFSMLSTSSTFGVTLPIGYYSIKGRINLTATPGTTTRLNTVYTGTGIYSSNITSMCMIATGTYGGAGLGVQGFVTDHLFNNTGGATSGAVIICSAPTAAVSTFFTWLDGVINVTTAGTFVPQFQWSTAGPTAATGIRAGSYLKIVLLGRQGTAVNIGGWA